MMCLRACIYEVNDLFNFDTNCNKHIMKYHDKLNKCFVWYIIRQLQSSSLAASCCMTFEFYYYVRLILL